MSPLAAALRSDPLPVATTLCRGQLALQAPLVSVEVNVGSGLPSFCVVGLPAAAVRESKERVRAALGNCGFEFPAGRITVSLAPADLPKEGARFDLPIALGILLASAQLRVPQGRHCEFYGELGLAGELKPVKGMLLAAAHAAQAGHELWVPGPSVDEARMSGHPAVHGADHLLEVCAHWGAAPPAAAGVRTAALPQPRAAVRDPRATVAAVRAAVPDLRDVRGQYLAKRALLVAAAGGHNLLLVGPPGAGKSMLAQRLPGLLPPLTRAQALEVAMIASVSARGFDPRRFGERPVRAPHHSASAHAIVGGGPQARPGEASLAHHGVLFLDELPEFDRRVLEALREPLETRVVAVARARMQAQYPAAFQLIAAMNPCPCGHLGDAFTACRCTPAQLAAYRGRLSGPLLDRIELRVEVARVPRQELLQTPPPQESSAAAAARVARARARQLQRAGRLNRDLPAGQLAALEALTPAARTLLERAFDQLGLSARAVHHVLRVALTVSDLESAGRVEAAHVAEAIQLRRAL